MAKITDPATIAACGFVSSYHEDLGSLAPKRFSAEEQHAITILAAYIRAQTASVDTLPKGEDRADGLRAEQG